MHTSFMCLLSADIRRTLLPRLVRPERYGRGERVHRRSMMGYNELISSPAEVLVPHNDRLRLAAAAYLARFKGASRDHNASDLRAI
jgi:hypothetical protein